MVYASIMGCLLVLFFIWQKLRDIIAPPFIICTIWTIMYVLLLFRKNTVDLSSIYYSSFFIGVICFVIGFFFVVKNDNKLNYYSQEEKNNVLSFNRSFMKIVIFIELVLFLFMLMKVSTYISGNYMINLWQTLSIGRRTGIYYENFLITYSRNAVIALSIVCSTVYFSNPNKKNRFYFLITLIIALFFAVTTGNRGVIFMLVLSTFFCNLIIKNYTNRKMAIILVRVVLLILAIFIVSAFYKYVYEDTSNIFEFIMKQMRIYFSTSMIAFVVWIEGFSNYAYGENTFRLFAGLLNEFGYNIKVSNIVQDFIAVYDDRTNVYTVLHYYAMDFGLVYAFIIQVILGLFHGFLYKKSILTKEIKPFFIAMLSIFYFPLINQFFDDKYFSILSTWIQFIFWFWLFTRKGFLNTNSSNNSTKELR